MELRVTGKNVEISEEVRQYLEKKLGKLAHHLPNITETTVEITREKAKEPGQRYVVQVTVNSRGTLLRGEVRASALAAAIDSVAQVLDRRIERFKGQRYERGRRAAERYGEAEAIAPEASPSPLRIVKSKHFEVKPMSVDEAIEQMELLGHDFFLFMNIDANQFNVIYRRRDDSYGLIEPVVG